MRRRKSPTKTKADLVGRSRGTVRGILVRAVALWQGKSKKNFGDVAKLVNAPGCHLGGLATLWVRVPPSPNHSS